MEALWLSRVRWRRRGAWMWPAFVVLTAAEALMIHALPLAGSHTGLFPAALIAGFANLIAVAAGAPLAGRALRRVRPDLPRVVAADRAGTALLCLVAVALFAAGLLNRPAASELRRDFSRQSAAVRTFVLVHVGPAYRRGLARADTWRIAEDLYRTCVPGSDPQRRLCLIVTTKGRKTGLRLDPNHAPNSDYVGPSAVGRER